MPPSQKFFQTIELKIASFSAFWGLILLQLNCLSYTHKLRLWLVIPAIASLQGICVSKKGDGIFA